MNGLFAAGIRVFFLNDIQRPVAYIGADSADVFTDDADADQLYSANKQYGQYERGPARHVIFADKS